MDPEPDPSDKDTSPSDDDTLAALSDTASEFGTHIDEPPPPKKPKSHSQVPYHHACTVLGPTDCHDFSLEVPLDDDEDCPLKDGQHLLPASIGQDATTMLTTAVLLDTGATINLISERFVPKVWRSSMQPYRGRGVKTANKLSLDVQGVIRLKVIIGDLRVNVWFGVSKTVAKRVILGTPFYYRFIRGCFPNEKK